MIFFNTNSIHTKSVSFFLAFLLIFNSFLLIGVLKAQSVQAQAPDPFSPLILAQQIKNFVVDKAKWVWDKAQAAATKAYQTLSTAFDAWSKSDSIMSKVSYALMYITINIMLTRMTQNIVGWLDGGAKGSPKIFQDFGQDFEDAIDLAGGAVIGGLLGLNNGELCDPNFLKVRLTIGLDELRAPTFAEKFKCSFTGGIKNIQAFKEDFTAGGWKSWVRFGRSENNNLGNYLTAQREIQKEQIKKTREVQAQVISGSGLKPQQVCRVTKGLAYVDELGFTGTKESAQNTNVRGRLSLGSKMKDIMGDYGYSNLAEFKSFWKFRGGDFACKIETPASAIAELSSKILTAPFDGLNDSLQAAATNLGKDAPAIFRPYLNAITTSAINLLIRKEKGLVSSAFAKRKTRNFKRQSSSIFKRASNDSLSGKKILGSAVTLRDQLLQSILDFNLFSGTLTTLLEKKNILFERPILVSEIIHEGYLWGAFGNGTQKIWLPNNKYPEDPTKNTSATEDRLIAERTKEVIDNKSAKGFPTLPVAGAMNLAGEVCGAFTQKLDSPNLNTTPYEVSKHIGFVALRDIDATIKSGDIYDGGAANGWFTIGGQEVRITAFSDAGLTEKVVTTDSSGNSTTTYVPIPDRFVRENLTTKEIVTFIDTGYGVNQILVGPEPNSPDPQIIYTGELTNVGSQDPRVQSREASTGDPDNLRGSVYYIEGSRFPSGTSIISKTKPQGVCADDHFGVRFVNNGTTATISVGGTGPSSDWGKNCGGFNYAEEIMKVAWGASKITFTVNFRDTRGGAEKSYTLTLGPTDPSKDYVKTAADFGDYGPQTYNVTDIKVTLEPKKILIASNTINGGTLTDIGWKTATLPVAADGLEAWVGNEADGNVCIFGVDNSFFGFIGDGATAKSITLTGVTDYAFGALGNASSISHRFMFPSTPDGQNITSGGSFASNKAAGLNSIPSGKTLRYYHQLADRGKGNPQTCRIYAITTHATSIDLIGIPAYIREAPYNIKYFSPILEGATATIENKKREIVYMDFLSGGNNPATVKDYLTLINEGDEPVSLKNDAHKDSVENENPFKMKMLEFFPEVSELQDEFMTKIRVLLGYTQGKAKSNLSSLADQIGAIPDEDKKYLSVSDVLTKYNDISSLYQDLFVGISSEETLEGLDPKYEILNPTETNIKLALIGKRCPTLPPSATSTPELIQGCQTLPTGEYNMAKKFVFAEDKETGFTTNPFTGSRSNVLAGILNLDEMTQQLTTLPPDDNIIKLLRLRQILEQLQVAPKDIILPGKISTTSPEALSGVDLVRLDLRNYPEIEEFLNMTATTTLLSGEVVPAFVYTDKVTKVTTITPYVTAEDLVKLYGFSSAKEAYPQISADIDNIFPEIITQVQDKLKEVFLKRVELELEKARLTAQKRLLDFIYFAEDLSPAVQVQVPKGFVSLSDSTDMKLGNEADSVVVRIVSSELAEPKPQGLAMNSASGDNCLSLSGEKIEEQADASGNIIPCDQTKEFELRGFKVLPWDSFSSNEVMSITSTSTQEEALKAATIRKSLMSGIRKKIEKFNKMLGKDVSSIEFKNSLQRYVLPLNDQGQVDVADWDKRIADGLHDINVLFTGLYSSETNSPNQPGIKLSPTDKFPQGKEIYTDIKTRMSEMADNFALLQGEFDKIKEDFTSAGANLISVYKNDIEEINKLLKKMKSNEARALACINSTFRGSNSFLLTFLLTGGGVLSGVASGFAFGGPIGALAGFLISGFLNRRAKKKARAKAEEAAKRCANSATRFNEATIELSNKFICGSL